MSRMPPNQRRRLQRDLHRAIDLCNASVGPLICRVAAWHTAFDRLQGSGSEAFKELLTFVQQQQQQPIDSDLLAEFTLKKARLQRLLKRLLKEQSC